jgi:hypothetical protein
MKKITSILTLAFLLMVYSASAQMECRSMLGAHLTPFSKKLPISWAIEGTMAPGIMTSPYDTSNNARLNGGMLLAALEFTLSKKNSIYIEGGYKNWKNSELVDDKNKSKGKHLGLRQFFYSYSGEKTKVKLGLHESRMGDFFLVDERILGGSLDQEVGAFEFNLRAATVLKNFARMGKFCSNRHLYGIIHPDYTEHIGEKLGETNMTGVVINWNPHYKKESSESASNSEFTESDADEFSSEDEFHENHDFNEFTNEDEFATDDEFSEADGSEIKQKQAFISITNVGLILYDEFGSQSYIPDNKFYIGSLFDFKLPQDFFFQAGPVFQNMKNNNTVVYIAKFGKTKTWGNASNTRISGAFIGKYDIDKDAIFQPLFSNLFLGEIMRLDAPDFPLWQAAIKHRFAGELKIHLAIKAVSQINDPLTNEQNLEFGIIPFKNHLKVTLVTSRVETRLLPKEFYTARLELRLAF